MAKELTYRKALEEAINRGTVTVSPNHFCLTGLAVYGMAKENCEVCREE